MSKKVLYGLLKAAARGEKPSRYLRRYSWWKRVIPKESVPKESVPKESVPREPVPKGSVPIIHLCVLALVWACASALSNWVNTI